METPKRYTISSIWAREKNIPATFIAVATRRTAKAIQLTGQGTLDARGNCIKCGRPLTHPVSLLTGVGPECGQHFWNEAVLGPFGFTEEHAAKLKQMVLNIRFENVWLPLSAIKETTETLEKITITEPKEKAPRAKEAKLVGKQIEIRFEFDIKVVAAIKTQVEGRRWEPNKKIWTAPTTIKNVQTLKALGFSLTGDDFSEIIQAYSKEIAGLTPTDKIDFGKLDSILRPFQKAGVEFINRCNGNALVADEMGLGKTIQALAWLDIHPEIRPAVIVVPASLKLNWAKEVRQWMNNKKTSYICSGKSPMATDVKPVMESDICIINYDVLTDYWIELFKKAGVQAMILDESHFIKNDSTKRTKAVKKLHRSVKHTIALSGTPITNRPIEFFTTIKLLAPQLFGSRFQYAMQFCNAHNNGYGWDFNGAKNTKELNDILTSSIMVRRLKKDVLKELPAKVISVVPMEIDNRAVYNRAEDDFIKYLKEIDPKKAKSAERAETLVKIEGMKQLTIAGKIKAAIAWIQDHIETNGKLVVFCTHKETINFLMAEFKDVAVRLDGSTSQTERQAVVDKFQTDEKIRLFVGNMQAAGVGITLTAASSVAFLELPWTPALVSQASDRVHRIGQKDSVNIYFLLADNTIEIEIAAILDEKQKIIEMVLDGQDVAEETLLQNLINKYTE